MSESPQRHNVFENVSTDEDIANNRIRVQTFEVARDKRLDITSDEEMWSQLEKEGFRRDRPITVTEDLMTGNLLVAQEQTWNPSGGSGSTET